MKKKLFMLLLLFTMLFAAFGCDGNGIINGITLTKVQVTGKSNISVGDTFVIDAKITPEGKYENKFTFTSSNEMVIEVNADGVVVGLAKGAASVIATSTENENLVGRLYVKVNEKSIEYTDEAPDSLKLIGSNEAYTGTKAYYRFETTPSNSSQDVKFITSNESIATIDNYGIATFKNSGSVMLTAFSVKNESVRASITVNVLESTRNSDYETQTKEVIKNTKNSILGVANYTYDSKHKLSGKSFGSGFVYHVQGILEDGQLTNDLNDKNIKKYMNYLVTNKHVVEGSDELKVYIHMIDEEVPATLIHYDDKVDMAVVKFEYSEYIKPLLFSDSSLVEQGDTVIAIGNPEGFEYSSSATRGIVSHPERYVSDDTDNDGVKDWDAIYIQHDASINPGNSGGPLLDMYGRVIGINTMKFVSNNIDNMGFSIPSNTLIELLPYLEKEKTPVRAKIGITVAAVIDLLQSNYESADYKYVIPEEIKTGLYITQVTEGSVSAGILQKDDILFEFNGIVLRKSIQLRAELGSIIVGSDTIIPVVVYRNGKEVKLNLKF